MVYIRVGPPKKKKKNHLRVSSSYDFCLILIYVFLNIFIGSSLASSGNRRRGAVEIDV